MLDSLFEHYAFKMLFAFIVLLGVLALALWLVRRFGRERRSRATPAKADSRGRTDRDRINEQMAELTSCKRQ
jgi:hypothetical protein